MAMAIQCGQKLIQQLWTVRHCAQTLAQSPRRIQPVANLAQVPWAAPPRHNTAKRARNIGQLPQCRPHRIAGQRRIMEPLHQRQARIDFRFVHEGGSKIGGQLPRTCTCYRAVNLSQQRPRASTFACAVDLQTVARGLINQKMFVHLAADGEF